MGADQRTADDDILPYLSWLLADLASDEVAVHGDDGNATVPEAPVPPSAGEFASPSLLWSHPDSIQQATTIEIPTHRFGVSRLAWRRRTDQ